MYFQLYITSRTTGKTSQISCDTFEEVQNEVEKRNPKFLRYDAFDSTGLIGTAHKYFNVLKNEYITYKKVYTK